MTDDTTPDSHPNIDPPAATPLPDSDPATPALRRYAAPDVTRWTGSAPATSAWAAPVPEPPPPPGPAPAGWPPIAAPDAPVGGDRPSTGTRLRVLTAGVAAAGVVAVGGIGLYAALDNTGVTTEPSVTDAGSDATTDQGLSPLDEPAFLEPADERPAPPDWPDGVAPPNRGAGPGHAATGGS